MEKEESQAKGTSQEPAQAIRELEARIQKLEARQSSFEAVLVTLLEALVQRQERRGTLKGTVTAINQIGPPLISSILKALKK